MKECLITNLEEYNKLISELNLILDKVKNFEFKFASTTTQVEPCSEQLNQEVP